MFKSALFVGACLSAAFSPFVFAEPALTGFTESVFVENNALVQTTGLAWAPDGSERLFAINKEGDVNVITSGSLNPTPFATISPVFTNSECGVIGIAFDPNYVVNRYVYFFVTVSASEQQIIRYTDAASIGTNKTVILANLPTLGQNHDGGGIGFGPDGMLYFSIGDLGNRTGVDGDLTSLASKVGRCNPDGSLPLDNPFDDGAGPNNDFIWARGFRNPFTLTFQPRTGKLWLDVTGDEFEQVFVVKRGSHGGWDNFQNNQPAGFLKPAIVYRTNGVDTLGVTKAVRKSGLLAITTSGTHGFRKGHQIRLQGVAGAGFDGSVAVLDTPSATKFRAKQKGGDARGSGGTAKSPDLGGAITGGCFYDSTAFPAQFQGNFFFCDYNSGEIHRAQLNKKNKVSRLTTMIKNVSAPVDVTTGPDGALYYANLESGRILRLAASDPDQRIIVSPTAFNMTESGTAAFTVRLKNQPTGEVQMTVARKTGDADVTIAQGASLTFTPANFATGQVVLVAAAADTDSNNDAATLGVDATGFAGIPVEVNVIDTTPSALVLSEPALELEEAGSGTLSVRLASAPGGSTQVNVTKLSGDADIAVSGSASLAFDAGNFSTLQNVTLSAAADADKIDDAALFGVTLGGETRLVTVEAKDVTKRKAGFDWVPPKMVVLGQDLLFDLGVKGNPAPDISIKGPVGMNVDTERGLLQWTPRSIGKFTVRLTALNGVKAIKKQTFVVKVKADAPPAAVVTQPAPDEVVSGSNSEFYGDGDDDIGTVKAEFFIDDMLVYTDSTVGGHYHLNGTHNLWNTTTLTNGVHALKMVVTDTIGQTGTTSLNVTVQN